MKKNIWLINHYAAAMYLDRAGRHYSFAKNLNERGYSPTIFCASTIHNSNNESIELGNEKYLINQVQDISFVFIKTPSYSGNGMQRIKNMFSFYRNLFPVAKEYAKKYGKPDTIVASSVHPLTLVAAIKIAKKLGVPCICEVRDLWPESLVAYGILKRKSLFTKLLYTGEKWIYKNADKLIFTMEGGKDYIIERGWDKNSGGPIDVKNIYHINNGVDLEKFNFNKNEFVLDDSDLSNEETFKVVYTGSIRQANNVKKIVEIGENIHHRGYKNIQFLIYGKGPDKESLENYCVENEITNIKFKGFIDKKYIPYVLSQSNLNIIQLFDQNELKQYGASLNKMFDYFASGKPTISDCLFGYDLIQKYKCGIVIDNATVEQLTEAIVEMSELPQEQYEVYCKNALIAARDYDFKVLTNQLEKLL
ncbi:glycosyltransferase involved in cell wall bisynthesis [Ureibacillus xyleni]|uniref:Glycosyltransferase involved in cell wall bisynthesis n=1 Tax=Ureibacillus xyleni TaxID=614648 RepID=A0A285RHL5_9BACL|nr:glycosyltransferase family 4 protein [Ureibacillus xyleni]SOB93603.1 glycosyltransferase involved in cell wall bisynthesis [Ureibacillus xyleni]